jgi:hypothetical protein
MDALALAQEAQPTMSPAVHWAIVLFSGLMAGAFCGMFPLGIGIAVKQRSAALKSFLICLVAGLAGGIILGFLVALVATCLIVYWSTKTAKIEPTKDQAA